MHFIEVVVNSSMRKCKTDSLFDLKQISIKSKIKLHRIISLVNLLKYVICWSRTHVLCWLKSSFITIVCQYQGEDKTGNSMTTAGPPPPPLPEPAPAPFPATRKADQPLGTISIQDLNSVQLRRTTKLLSKTMSAPLAATGNLLLSLWYYTVLN